MRYVILAFLVVLLVLCAATFSVAGRWSKADAAIEAIARQFDLPPGNNASTVRFSIQKGESASSIAKRLEAQRLIGNSWLFLLVARLRGAEGHLEAGDYVLRRNLTMGEMINELQSGRLSEARITVVEGWRMEEIADLLTRRKIADGEEFRALARATASGDDFLSSRPVDSTLEGYLFPDTYSVAPGATSSELIAAMLRNFGQRFDGRMREQTAKSGLTIHQVVTLASIVEREAVMAEERPFIAGVFLNRLKMKMPLQADPTVQYARFGPGARDASGDGYWSRPLTTADLALDSPYNTYRNQGLPPGPIANPGLASLRAVLEPAATDYLYFVAKDDASHAFAQTLQEHNSNVAKYRK